MVPSVNQMSWCRSINLHCHSLFFAPGQSAKNSCTPSLLWSFRVHPTTRYHQLPTFVKHDRPWNFHPLSTLSKRPIDSDRPSSLVTNWCWPVDRPDKNCQVCLALEWLVVWLTAHIWPISASSPIAKVLRVGVIHDTDLPPLTNWDCLWLVATIEKIDKLKTSFQDCSSGSGQAQQQ